MKNNEIAVLEQFPAWQKCRELNKIVNSQAKRIEKDREYMRASSVSAQSEDLMMVSAELFETSENCEKSRLIKRLLTSCSRLKSGLYSNFDLGKIAKEEFEEVLFPLNVLIKELKAGKAEIENRKPKALNRKPVTGNRKVKKNTGEQNPWKN